MRQQQPVLTCSARRVFFCVRDERWLVVWVVGVTLLVLCLVRRTIPRSCRILVLVCFVISSEQSQILQQHNHECSRRCQR